MKSTIFVNTSSGERLGAKPDQYGKNYFRLTFERVSDFSDDLFGWLNATPNEMLFAQGMKSSYEALASSELVIPTSQLSTVAGDDVAVVDVVVRSNSPGATVADLVNQAENSSYFTHVRQIERIRASSAGAQVGNGERDQYAQQQAAAKAQEDGSFLGDLKSGLTGLNSTVSLVALAVLAGAAVWFLPRSR